MKSLSLTKPHVIVMVGIPGSGKSFFAERFSETFNAPYVSFGRLRDEFFEEPTYSSDEKATVSRLCSHLLAELYKTKATFIYEGVADARIDRQEITKKAHSAGYEAVFVWVQTESNTAKSRIKKAKSSATISPGQFDDALRRFSPPHGAEKPIVISGKHTYASQLRIVLKRLVEPRIEEISSLTPPPRPTGNRTIVVR